MTETFALAERVVELDKLSPSSTAHDSHVIFAERSSLYFAAAPILARAVLDGEADKIHLGKRLDESDSECAGLEDKLAEAQKRIAQCEKLHAAEYDWAKHWEGRAHEIENQRRAELANPPGRTRPTTSTPS